MKKLIFALVIFCVIFSSAIPALALVIDLQQIDNTEVRVVQIDKNDPGLTIDDYTDTDGITYPDEYYRIERKFDIIPHTFQAWVKIPKAINGEYVGTILGNFRGTGTPSFMFSITENNTPCLYWVDEDNTTHTIRFDARSDDGLGIPYDEWTHITFVHDDEAKAVSLYVDGELYGTNTADYSEIQQATFMRVRPNLTGDNRYWNRKYFRGALSTVAFYSSALSAAEVKSTYEDGVRSDRDDLVLLYGIDSSSKGKDIIDLSGNGYNAEYGTSWLTEEEMYSVRLENGTIDENGNPTYAYSLAFIPDIQYLTRYYPANLPTVFEWIVDSKEEKKIEYVIGLGDITDSNTEEQWQIAKDAVTILDGEVEYSLVRGNHDVTNDGKFFNQFFASHTPYTEQFTKNGGTYSSG